MNEGVFNMSKYSLKLKLKIVKEYNSGKLSSLNQISKTFNIPKTSIVDIIFRYNNFGINGLKKKTNNNNYTSNFKLSVIQYKRVNQLSYSETAKVFGIHNSAMIYAWEKKYNEKGIDGLKIKQGRQPKMKLKKNKSNKKINETEREELIRLRKEKHLLELELIYEKKLQALLMEEETKVGKKQK